MNYNLYTHVSAYKMDRRFFAAYVSHYAFVCRAANWGAWLGGGPLDNGAVV